MTDLSHITKKEFYSDRDIVMTSYYVGDIMYSISKLHKGRYYLLQCTHLDIFFDTDSEGMAHKVMKLILVKD